VAAASWKAPKALNCRPVACTQEQGSQGVELLQSQKEGETVSYREEHGQVILAIEQAQARYHFPMKTDGEMGESWLAFAGCPSIC
jgi:hypothetical protein